MISLVLQETSKHSSKVAIPFCISISDRVPVASHPHLHLVLSVFWIWAILIGVHLVSSAQLLSRARLFVTPWIVAHQASLSMGFPRQEYWSGLPFPSPEDLPYPGIESRSPALQADSLLSEPDYYYFVFFLSHMMQSIFSYFYL